MADADCEMVDPRIRRTRQLLQQALDKLLETRNFDEISVQDIAELATVNRATFYDHYPDKFALLKCSVAGRFHRLLAERQVRFDGSCAWAIEALIRAVCEFRARAQGGDCERQRQFNPFLEASIIDVTRGILLEGLERHPPGNGISPELVATAVAWAIYGAAGEWVDSVPRVLLDELVTTVLRLILPMLSAVPNLELHHK